MKKLFIIAMLFIAGATQAQVTFRPGLRGGVNFAHFTKGDDYSYGGFYDFNGNYVPNGNQRIKYKSKTDLYLGFYGALRLSKFYTLQPEINYSRQGAISEGSNGLSDTKLEVSYLSVGLVNKFSFSEKFNMHIGPTIDFQVEDNFNTDSEVDLAFLLGFGYNINKNIGLEARIKKGVIPVLDFSQSNHSNVVFSLGMAYTFDVK